MHDRLVSRRIDALHQCLLVFFITSFKRQNAHVKRNNAEHKRENLKH